MPIRVIYHVLPAPKGWQVRKGKAVRASSVHASKAAAVKSATALAKGHARSQVVIHAANGTITGDRTYDGKALARKRKVRAIVKRILKTKAKKKAKRRKAARQGVVTRQKRTRALALKRSASAKKAAVSRRRRS